MSTLTCLLAVVLTGASADADRFPADRLSSFDQYGGWKAVRFEPGEFFRTTFDGERWWLVTPEGHAFLSIGACVVGPRGSYIRGTRIYPYYDNVLAKHGDVKTWAKATRRRLRAWGFNTKACWSGGEVQDMPRADILNFCGGGGTWLEGRMPDFFDPNFAAHAEKVARRTAESKDDPWLIGWFLDNELGWDRDWRMAPHLFVRYAKLPAKAPGKRAWRDFLKDRHKTCEAFNKVYRPSIEDWDALLDVRGLRVRQGQEDAGLADRRGFVLMAARKYFQTCVEAIRRHDPNHLVLGCRFVSWVVPRMVVKAAGEYCDVVTINFYELGPIAELAYARWSRYSDYVRGQPDMSGFYELAGKPLLITEFGFRSRDSGLPNTYPPGIVAQPTVGTQKERAERFTRYVNQWMGKPFFVGYHWFRWMDEPKEGRFDGENGNYGLVDIRDEPYEEFIQRITPVNQGVWQRHVESGPTK